MEFQSKFQNLDQFWSSRMKFWSSRIKFWSPRMKLSTPGSILDSRTSSGTALPYRKLCSEQVFYVKFTMSCHVMLWPKSSENARSTISWKLTSETSIGYSRVFLCGHCKHTTSRFVHYLGVILYSLKLAQDH